MLLVGIIYVLSYQTDADWDRTITEHLDNNRASQLEKC